MSCSEETHDESLELGIKETQGRHGVLQQRNPWSGSKLTPGRRDRLFPTPSESVYAWSWDKFVSFPMIVADACIGCRSASILSSRAEIRSWGGSFLIYSEGIESATLRWVGFGSGTWPGHQNWNLEAATWRGLIDLEAKKRIGLHDLRGHGEEQALWPGNHDHEHALPVLEEWKDWQ